MLTCVMSDMLGIRRLMRRSDRYLEQLQHAKIKGYLFQQQNYYAGGKEREG